MKHRIQLIGFDGEDYWKLFYIEVRDNKEVYYGLEKKLNQLSFSRHGSGLTNVKIDNQKIKLTDIVPEFKKLPLSKLKGIESLGNFNPIDTREKISKEEYKKYVSKKSSAIFLIDLRNFDGTINLQTYLINPDDRGLIMKREFKHECQLYIYTASNPWVAFYILNVKLPTNS